METGSLKWGSVYRRLKTDAALKDIFSVFDLIRCLPPTSVNNETTFSAMKLIKSKRRGHMSNQMLNDTMLIHMQSPGIEEFDPTPCVKQWLVNTKKINKKNIKIKTFI